MAFGALKTVRGIPSSFSKAASCPPAVVDPPCGTWRMPSPVPLRIRCLTGRNYCSRWLHPPRRHRCTVFRTTAVLPRLRRPPRPRLETLKEPVACSRSAGRCAPGSIQFAEVQAVWPASGPYPATRCPNASKLSDPLGRLCLWKASGNRSGRWQGRLTAALVQLPHFLPALPSQRPLFLKAFVRMTLPSTCVPPTPVWKT